MTCCQYDSRDDAIAADAWYAEQAELGRLAGEFALVTPERTTLSFARATTHTQVACIVAGEACPTCRIGLVSWGDAQCARCMSEADRARIEADCAEFRAEVRVRLDARDTINMKGALPWLNEPLATELTEPLRSLVTAERALCDEQPERSVVS